MRLVQSGIGQSWDDEVDAVNKGWGIYLRNLRHYIERHNGKSCHQAMIVMELGLPQEEAWERLVGRELLARGGRIQGIAAGNPYQVETSWGDKLRGTVEISEPPSVLYASADDLPGSFNVNIEAKHGHTYLFASVLAYGMPEGETKALESRWQTAFQKALAK